MHIDASVRGKHVALYNELLYEKRKDPLEQQRAIEYDRRYVYASTGSLPSSHNMGPGFGDLWHGSHGRSVRRFRGAFIPAPARGVCVAGEAGGCF
jgi:hypothetical protein